MLEQQRERLLAELQQRMALSGQLAPILGDDDEAAAGRLWDMSKASLQPGDYQLMLQYGDFLAQQPELLKLAQQLSQPRGKIGAVAGCPYGGLSPYGAGTCGRAGGGQRHSPER